MAASEKTHEKIEKTQPPVPPRLTFERVSRKAFEFSKIIVRSRKKGIYGMSPGAAPLGLLSPGVDEAVS
jgi:hypothetical protein